MPHNKHTFLLTKQAHDTLFNMFRKQQARSTVLRNSNESVFDGVNVSVYAHIPSLSHEGVSHALRTLAQSYSFLDWVDNRQPYQISQCERMSQESIITFNTSTEARVYYQQNSIITAHIGTALWSDIPLIDYSDLEDSETGELLQSKTRQQYDYVLDHATITYYANLARYHKMRSPTMNSRATSTGLAAACFEAIGTGWLLPPEDYQILLNDTPNSYKARDYKRKTGKKLYGNLSGTPYVPDPNRWKPFTPQRAKELLEQNPTPTPTLQQQTKPKLPSKSTGLSRQQVLLAISLYNSKPSHLSNNQDIANKIISIAQRHHMFYELNPNTNKLEVM